MIKTFDLGEYMKAINIFEYTRIQSDLAIEFENILSQSKKKIKTKEYEFDTLSHLVALLISIGVSPMEMNNFFLSYDIDQIGKEFDLLKIDKNNQVLNIELKSDEVDEQDILNQLEKNQYYLKHIAPKIYLFTFVSQTESLFKFENNKLHKINIIELKNVLSTFQTSMNEGIEVLFKPNNYLISPLNSADKFLKDDYYLTNQQCTIKKKIMKQLYSSTNGRVLGITGKPGTGKTLLLYDIVKEIAKSDKKCCVIHCGNLCSGHLYLNNNWKNVKILTAKDLKENNDILSLFQFIFVDESQRMHYESLNKIIDAVNNNKIALFSYDYEQYLSIREKNRNIPQKLKEMNCFEGYELSDRIRTSREIASFCKSLLDLNQKARGFMDYSQIEVIYANNIDEAKLLISLYTENEYIFISYTQSLYTPHEIDLYPRLNDTHHVLGQEYDKVMIELDNNFRYGDDGRMKATSHPNPDYLFAKLLYMAISRARQHLCILVVENYELFGNILRIKYEMLEKFQYRESKTNTSLSTKRLSKLTKNIKDIIKTIDTNIAITVSESVDIINDDLNGADLHMKIINCGIRLLDKMKQDTPLTVQEAINEYCEYVSTVIK